MERFKLFTFNSTHQAMLMEKVIKESGHGIRLIPIPRNLSASCGLAARVALDEFEVVCKAAEDNGVEIAGVYDF